MARPYLFDQQELDLFELDADNFNSESVRKHYRRFLLQHHPDKGGTNEMCARGNSIYPDLLEGLLTFSVWLNNTPGLTLADTIRPRPASSGEQPEQSKARLTISRRGKTLRAAVERDRQRRAPKGTSEVTKVLLRFPFPDYRKQACVSGIHPAPNLQCCTA